MRFAVSSKNRFRFPIFGSQPPTHRPKETARKNAFDTEDTFSFDNMLIVGFSDLTEVLRKWN